MPRSASARPGAARRVAAVLWFLLTAVVIVAVVLNFLDHPVVMVVTVLLVLVLPLAVWWMATRAGAPRALAVLLAIAIVVALALLAAITEGRLLLLLVLSVPAIIALGVFALQRDRRTLQQQDTEGTPVPAARRGALIMNLRSGGGKAERFHLVDECRKRGIEPIVLQQGDDLLQLARDAIDRGADVIGMAGGDGSQALVASVAAQRGIPMVVVPAGTRNHLALDLGLDRDDVVGALAAFEDAVERTMDLAEVNGRVFVNNVSLGLYATIVESPEYRDAKRETTLSALPAMLGPGTQPFDLRFTTDAGVPQDGAHMILVSNGPYGKTLRTMGSRPRLDTGRLGIIALVIPDDGASARFIAAVASGNPDRYEGYMTWEAPSFEVASGSSVPIGLDGESLSLEPPLVFTVRPGALQVRLPHSAIGLSPAARYVGWRSAVPALWQTVLGRPVDFGS